MKAVHNPICDILDLSESNKAVEHPSHYHSASGFEVKDAIEAWGLGRGFRLGNVIKYVARAGHKGDYLEDLEKAMFYLREEIEIERAKRGEAQREGS